MTDSSGQVPASSRTNRLRGRCPWLGHVFRAVEWFGKHHGNYYAAAITYFSVLSVVPVLMVGFACAAVVLAGDHAMLVRLQTEIGTRVPGSLGDVINNLVREAVEARGTVGVIGLVIAVYSGVGWMTHLRGAVTEQWGLTWPKLPVVSTALKDLLALAGLGLALVVSFAVTAVVGADRHPARQDRPLTDRCGLRSGDQPAGVRQSGGPTPAVLHRMGRDISTAAIRAGATVISCRTGRRQSCPEWPLRGGQHARCSTTGAPGPSRRC